jgi:hypothetical protein
MTPIFFVTAGVMLIVALSLVLWPLQRSAAKSMSRVREAAGKLGALNEVRTEGGVGEAQSAALQAAIDELLSATVDLERLVLAALRNARGRVLDDMTAQLLTGSKTGLDCLGRPRRTFFAKSVLLIVRCRMEFG